MLVSNGLTVGTYALTVGWSDGHNTGIYAWDVLRRLGDRAGEREQHDV